MIALVGPALLGIDLAAAAKDYEAKHGGGGRISAGQARPGTASSCEPSG